MYTTAVTPDTGKAHKRGWRRHSDDFKARVIALALEPHASVASVALAHGINANMLRCWVRAHTTTLAPTSTPSDSSHAAAPDERSTQTLSFVQLPVEAGQPPKAPVATPSGLPPPSPLPPPTSALVEVQIQRGETRLVVRLPMISDSAAWVREVLG